MKRINRVGVSISLLAVALGGIATWILVHVWTWGKVTLQEPIFPILVIETIGLGLTTIFGMVCLIYFWRYKWKP